MPAPRRAARQHSRRLLSGLAFVLVCAPALAAEQAKAERGGKDMAIASPAFRDGDAIPMRYTCDGDDISPPLNWSAPPEGTKSLALIVDAPDAPTEPNTETSRVHWLLYNLPPSATALSEGIAIRELPPGTRPGVNGWQLETYSGPCSPSGEHRYAFRLYALGEMLPDLGRPNRDALENAMRDRILARSELIGVYQHQGQHQR